MELHEQSWTDGIGWFTQSRVRVDSTQLPFIRQALGDGSPAMKMPSPRPAKAAGLGLRVVHADSA